VNTGVISKFLTGSAVRSLKGLAVDPLDPRNVYALANAWGYPSVYWGRWNAGYTSIDWTDISSDAGADFPQAVFQGSLSVNPWNGEVIATCQNGAWIRKSLQGGNSNHSFYDRAVKPIPKVA
jgi:hypothetical protein